MLKVKVHKATTGPQTNDTELHGKTRVIA